MKKILFPSLMIFISFAAVGINAQMWYKGAWSPTVQYSVKPISGSTTASTTPVVESAGIFYIATGASTPIKGVKPSSNAAAWESIN